MFWRDRFWEIGLRRLVRAPIDVPIFLGISTKRTSMFAAVRTAPLWRCESLSRKIRCILSLKWIPDTEALKAAGRELFLHEVFGEEEDFGPQFFRLSAWHESRNWDLAGLTEHDNKRVEALEAFTVLTRMRLSKFRSSPPLNLHLAIRNPILPITAIPMVAKIPVISFQYFLNIHATFAFASIRRSGHDQTDALISFLYELLFLQQKIAIALHEYIRLSAFSLTDKKDAALINAEVDAIMGADLIFSYLKASLEKTVAMTGLVFGIRNLESMKTHKSRYAALVAAIPEFQKNTPYGIFFLEFVKSENLQELNSYRSGLLHKRGIADLQPHNYVSKESKLVPFRKIFSILHEQHAKNTGVLLSALALLTDKLVEIDPPDMSQDDLRMIFSQDEMAEWWENATRLIESKPEPGD